MKVICHFCCSSTMKSAAEIPSGWNKTKRCFMIFHLIKHLGWRSNFFKHKASSLEPIISCNFAKHCFSNVSAGLHAAESFSPGGYISNPAGDCSFFSVPSPNWHACSPINIKGHCWIPKNLFNISFIFLVFLWGFNSMFVTHNASLNHPRKWLLKLNAYTE